MMEWISVQSELPSNDCEVLILVEGYFPEASVLSQKPSVRHCQGSFNRSSGWKIKGLEGFVKYWMPLPESPEDK